MSNLKKTRCGKPFFWQGVAHLPSQYHFFLARCGSPFAFFAAGVAHLFKTYK